MIRKSWLTFCSTIFCAASASTLMAQPNSLPPPPSAASSASDAPSKAPAQAPLQAPTQAPTQAPAVPSGPQIVTCTVMVPQVSYQTMTVPAVVCRPEVRQQTVNVCRLVPETQMVNCTQTVVVPERRTSQQQYTACRMTYETVSRQVTIDVPQLETRTGTRTVCKPVAVQETATVCRDAGGWTTQCYTDCCGCTHSCQVWMPKIVTEQVPVTAYKPQFVEESFQYQVMTCRQEQRTIQEQVAKPVYETKTREVSYVVPVAKQIERQVPQTTLKPVMEQRTVNYTVMVPQEVQRQVTVPVCTMVAKQVTYQVSTCPPCGGCGW